ncbi:MAG: argininosuccinate synthase [Alphaproteobacteria bacterium]|jgi:argininosuccinate synthase|tara:strand:+ start:750 stop:1943 length:1194 start_codon:yes stop_codon:yes gene_type:complete
MKSKIVLAYSGGLDTSVILKWLQTEYNADVIAYAADLGQGAELDEAKAKAKKLGAKKIYIENLKEEFVRDYVFPMFRCNTIYEGEYLLGTSIARPLIAKRQIEIAKREKANAVSHGATGKGNDQVRFEFSYYALEPKIKVIAPWREWDLSSRTKLLEFAAKHKIPIMKHNRTESPYSVDANVLHRSAEGKILEDPWKRPPENVFGISKSPQSAPNKETVITIQFKKGDAVAINGKKLSPFNLLEKLNKLGAANGIGRVDIVENRYVGIKSRGVYETPGGTILLKAHRAMESITLDREEVFTKDELMPKYARLVYNGYWFAPERIMMQKAIDETQKRVNGEVKLVLYKGNVIVIGRKSPNSLYDEDLATFESSNYDQRDAEGFIKLNALRLKKNKLKF